MPNLKVWLSKPYNTLYILAVLLRNLEFPSLCPSSPSFSFISQFMCKYLLDRGGGREREKEGENEHVLSIEPTSCAYVQSTSKNNSYLVYGKVSSLLFPCVHHTSWFRDFRPLLFPPGVSLR